MKHTIENAETKADLNRTKGIPMTQDSQTLTADDGHREILVGHSYKLAGWPEDVKIATVLHKGLDDSGNVIFLGMIRYKSPVDADEIEYAETADWEESGMFHAASGPSKLDLGPVIGPFYPQWIAGRAVAIQNLITTTHNYLKWCEKAIGAGPVGNPHTHTWHNQQMRDAIKALTGDQ